MDQIPYPMEHAVPLNNEAKRQNTLVWVAQLVLFAAFLTAGFMKLTMPIEELARIMTWPGAVSPWLVRFIGAAEVAGALGVLLPQVTGIKPILVSYAAFGLMIVMIAALGYHLMLFQGMMLLPNIGLGLLAAYVGVRRMP